MPAPDPAASDESSPHPKNGNGSSHQDGGQSESSGDLHQRLLREVNEQIERLNGEWELDGHDTIMCECGHPECMEKIEIATLAYQRVRRFPTRFVVKRGHATTGSERIVERAYGYDVVEKVGHTAATAIRLDPRRPSPSTR